MSVEEEFRHVELVALCQLRAAVCAVEQLVAAREQVLQPLINGYRARGGTQLEVERYGEALHQTERECAFYLLRELSGSHLSRWVLKYSREALANDLHRT